MNLMDKASEKTVLLVDDEEDIRDVLSLSLMDSGYNVHTAENGKQALEIFKKTSPDVVITDIKMPGMDGIELLDRIKNENPDAEIIMITGHGDMDLAIKSFRYHAAEFITKPIDLDDLENALKKVYEKITLREQLRQYTANLEDLVYKKSMVLAETEKQALAFGETDQGYDNFHRLFDNMPCYITMLDPKLKFVAINKRFQEDFGDRTGDFCYEICKSQAFPCEECPVGKTFETGKYHQTETEWSSTSNKKYTVLIWTSPIKSASNDVTNVIVMATNITQVLNLRDHLASLGLMLGSISHSIKGLLTGLDGGIYLLDSGLGKNNPKLAKEGFEIVKDMVARIKKMILDILFYAKERDIKKQKIDIRDFAEDVATIFYTKANKSNIKFILKVADNIPEIEIDPDSIHSALVNILDNALEACTKSGKTDSQVIFDIKGTESDELIFVISDNGIGMSPVTTKKIFDLFFSTKGESGTGFGLFIANHIIMQHSGSIGVKSELGKGTVFTIKLPSNVS